MVVAAVVWAQAMEGSMVRRKGVVRYILGGVSLVGWSCWRRRMYWKVGEVRFLSRERKKA